MKRIEDLTKEDYQTFLDKMFENSVEFNRLILTEEDNERGIEYKVKKGLHKGIVSFGDPELVEWLYKKEIDITMPLELLKLNYMEIDETNSTLFQFVMGVTRIMNIDNLWDEEKYSEIGDLQKELISKL